MTGPDGSQVEAPGEGTRGGPEAGTGGAAGVVADKGAPPVVPEEQSTPAGSRPRRPWYLRPSRIILLVLAVVLVGGGIPFYLSWRDRGAREASVDEAVEEFRRENGSAPDGTTATTPEGGFALPEAGVYTYLGEGDEKLSLLDTRQSWGPRMPAVLTHLEDGCWNLRIRFSTNHRQEFHYCPEGKVLYENGGITYQSFDFVAFSIDDTNVFVCDPRGVVIRADAEEGESWESGCSGESKQRHTEVTSSGPNTFVGIETVDIGGEQVEAYHYRSERELEGSQVGTEVNDTWYALETGLPLEGTRAIRVSSPSPIGDVIYTEEGTFTLTALEPRR